MTAAELRKILDKVPDDFEVVGLLNPGDGPNEINQEFDGGADVRVHHQTLYLHIA